MRSADYRPNTEERLLLARSRSGTAKATSTAIPNGNSGTEGGGNFWVWKWTVPQAFDEPAFQMTLMLAEPVVTAVFVLVTSKWKVCDPELESVNVPDELTVKPDVTPLAETCMGQSLLENKE